MAAGLKHEKAMELKGGSPGIRNFSFRKQAEVAFRLFYLMPEMDEMACDEIIAEPLSEDSIGVAIMDQLRRTSL